MKKLVLIAAIAALSACDQKAEEAPAATDTAMAEATPMADAAVTPGTYEVKMPDGTVGRTTINADGTYVDIDKDGKEMKGKFVRRDGKDCFDPDGDEGEMCWTSTAPDASGAFTSTTADGKTTVTVTPVAGTATTVTTTTTPAPAAT